MKSINDIIIEGKSGELKTIYILTLMIPFQMWKEYNVYNDFFGKLSDDEINDWEYFIKWLDEIDSTNKRVRFSAANMYFDHINKLADYVINSKSNEFGIHDKKIWKEIKAFVS